MNVAHELRARAAEAPARAAIVAPDGRRGWRRTSYAELDAQSDALAHGLVELGLRPGDRALVFLRPGAHFPIAVWALFKLGAVPVLIDPGMGRGSLLRSIEMARARALIGVLEAHVARACFAGAFRSVEIRVLAGRSLGFPAARLERLIERDRGPFPIYPAQPGTGSAGGHPAQPGSGSAGGDTAAILFTSGSTGPAKGVVHTHANFRAEMAALRALYDLTPGLVHAACFPPFALFDHALGLTSVFPRLDASRPGRCDPAEIHAAIEEHGAGFSFGSPAIWRRVAPWMAARGLAFTSLRTLAIAGAPVSLDLIGRAQALLPPGRSGGEVHTPYGATEALPVANARAGELLALAERVLAGAGTCVGRAAPGAELCVIPIDDGPIERWSDALALPPGEPGEICARGPAVTRAYAFDEAATRASKIASPESGSGPWHRMGDVGRFDAEGRLWFLGRKAHRLETPAGRCFPVPFENVVDRHAAVRRSALIGAGPRGAERPVLVVEPARGRVPRGARARALAAEILAHGRSVAPAPAVERVLFRRRLPVDARHNAKIKSELLKRWVERQLP